MIPQNMDEDEVAVVCTRCNSYLWSVSIWDVSDEEATQHVKFISCPYHKPEYPIGDQCQPGRNEQKYGRS